MSRLVHGVGGQGLGVQGVSHRTAAPSAECRGAGVSMAGCGGVCGTGRGGTRVYGERCSSHSTASHTAIVHLSDRAADDLERTHTELKITHGLQITKKSSAD